MEVYLKEHIWNYKDWILLVIFIFYDVGTLGFLPLNFNQILILILGMFIFIEQLYIKKRLTISKKIIILLIYMGLITFTHKFDFESIKSYGFFSLELVIIYWYIIELLDYHRLFEIIYKAAFILSIYGVIQEIAFIMGITQIYDITLYGFHTNGTYITKQGLIRAMSLYREPAHLCMILPFSFMVGLVAKDKRVPYVKTYQTMIILACIICTQSTLVYVDTLFLTIVFVFLYRKNLLSKLKWILWSAFIVIILTLINTEMILSVFTKVSTMFNMNPNSTNDLSAWAIISNFKIAYTKFKEGYIFGTGIDSHRFSYYKYIDQLYSSYIMQLNVSDAGSYYTKIFSEFGIIGLCVLLGGIVKKFFNAVVKHDEYILMFVSTFMITILRNGKYESIFTMINFIILFIIPLTKHKYLSE